MTFATWRRKSTCGPPTGDPPITSRVPATLAAMLLAAGCLTAIAASALVVAPAAHASTVPSAPSGWTTVFSDNFAGAAGSAPSAQTWTSSTR